MSVEYILRQVEPGLADPLIIHLNEEENFIGRQMIPELTKYIKVSRMHGYIKKRGTEFHIRDLGSLNGVYVNGIKIGKELHKLEIGDYIGFGAPSFNDGGFACTFSAKVASSGAVKREKSAFQELEENPQKKIKQESEELEPEANKILLENESMYSASVISNKLQQLEHPVGDGSNLIKIKQEIVETEDIVSEDNLKNISFFSVHESSDKLNNCIFDKYVPSNYEEISRMGSDQSGIYLSSRHSDEEESKINNSADTKIINKTFKASEAARISNSVCQTEVKLFKGLENEVYASGYSRSGTDTKHVIISNIPCVTKEVDLTEKKNLLMVKTDRAFIKPLHQVHDIRKVPFTEAEEIICISDDDEMTACGNTFERSKEYVEKSNEENLQMEHIPIKCPQLVSSKPDEQPIGLTGVYFSNTLNKNELERKEIAKSCGKTLLIEPLPMRYRNLRVRNKEESFKEYINYENKNIKERNNVGMVSLSRKACEESMKKISDRNPNVGSKCEQSNDMQEISKLEINPSCISFKVKESNHINANELDRSSIENKGVSKSPAIAQRRENYGSRISSLVETMLGGKKAFARKTVQKNINYQVARKRNHSEPVGVMETNMKNIHSEPQGKTYDKKSINAQSECESSVSSVKLQVGCASDNLSKVNLKVTYSDNKAELTFAPLGTRKLTEEPCSSYMSFSKTNLVLTRNTSNIFPYHKKNNLEVKDPLSPAQMINFYSVLEEVLGFDVSSMINNVQEYFPFGDATSLPLSFESLDSYTSSFHLALLAKLWDSISYESKAIIQRSEKDLRKFYMRVLSYKMNNNIMELDCESVVDKLSFCPCEGFVILLHCEDKTKDNYMIGYIKKHCSRRLDLQALTQEWKCLGPKYTDEASIINFTVYMKVQRTYPLCRKLLIANAICNIKGKLILADTFNYLQLSPLCKDILYPREKTFFLSNPSGLSSKPPFSCSPNEAILAISDVINKAAVEPKIIMLHMSSRDKTQTIIGLLQNLLTNNNNKIKVLVTAPSNAAVDKIGLELIEANESYASNNCCIKFVRLGLSKSMHFRLLPHSLDSKATQLYQETMKNEVEFEKKELNILQASIDELKKKQTNIPDRNIEQKLQFLTNQYECLKQNINSENFLSHSAHMKYKLSVLNDSNVILSTLGSSTQTMLMSALGPHSEMCFTCCIIDEATKCSELEILQPLRLGFNKLVLFGNFNEKQYSFSGHIQERSMFERFHLFFQTYKPSPLFNVRKEN